MAFIESPRFPDSISYGSSGGPRFKTVVVPVSSGFEYNNIQWDQARHLYDVSLGVRSLEELGELVKFFQVVRGKGHYFRYKDWADYKSCDVDKDHNMLDQVFGIGDGVETSFQLIKTYDILGGIINERHIRKPVDGTISVAINSSGMIEGGDYTLDYTTGIVTFTTPPAISASITWGGEFDVPCRFDVDELNVSMDFYGYGSASITVMEVRV